MFLLLYIYYPLSQLSFIQNINFIFHAISLLDQFPYKWFGNINCKALQRDCGDALITAEMPDIQTKRLQVKAAKLPFL